MSTSCDELRRDINDELAVENSSTLTLRQTDLTNQRHELAGSAATNFLSMGDDQSSILIILWRTNWELTLSKKYSRSYKAAQSCTSSGCDNERSQQVLGVMSPRMSTLRSGGIEYGSRP